MRYPSQGSPSEVMDLPDPRDRRGGKLGDLERGRSNRQEVKGRGRVLSIRKAPKEGNEEVAMTKEGRARSEFREKRKQGGG